MPVPSRKIINADGNVVDLQDSNADNNSTSLTSRCELDVFGFNLDVRQFLIALAVISLMLGPQGTIALLIALAAYTVFMRVTRNSSGGSNTRRSGGGRGWGGGGGGGGGGPQIRGVKDLPCDPKVG